MNSRDLLLIGGGALVGLVVGVPAGVVLLDKKVRKEYEASADTMQTAFERALAAAQAAPAEAPVSEEELLEEIKDGVRDIAVNVIADEMQEAFTGSLTETFAPARVNPYHDAVVASNTPNSFALAGTPLAIEIIDPEDFDDEDGRIKHTVVMLKAELGLPMVFLDGSATDEWNIHLGDTMVSDFYRVYPDGQGTLYMRNNQRDEDYAITQELP